MSYNYEARIVGLFEFIRGGIRPLNIATSFLNFNFSLDLILKMKISPIATIFWPRFNNIRVKFKTLFATF